MSGLPFFVFSSGEAWEVLNEVVSQKPQLIYHTFSSTSSLASNLKGFESGIVLLLIRNRNDLPQVDSFLQSHKLLLRNKAWKIVPVTFATDPIVDREITRFGMNEVLKSETNAKALHLKFDFWMKALQKASGQDTKSQAQDKKESKNLVIYTDPLKTEEDLFLGMDEAKPKRIMGRWLVNMVGPSPYAIKWVKTKNPLVWRLDIIPELKDMFAPGEGAWFFKGDVKPDFIWTENKWSFTGEAFELFYEESKGTTHSRISASGTYLKISKNSLYAETKREFIQETFENEYHTKAREEEDLNKKIEEEKSSHLVDQSHSTEHLDHGPLKGKIKQQSADPVFGDDFDIQSLDIDSTEKKKKHGHFTEEYGPMKGKIGSEKKVNSKKEEALLGDDTDPESLPELHPNNSDRLKDLSGKINNKPRPSSVKKTDGPLLGDDTDPETLPEYTPQSADKLQDLKGKIDNKPRPSAVKKTDRPLLGDDTDPETLPEYTPQSADKLQDLKGKIDNKPRPSLKKKTNDPLLGDDTEIDSPDPKTQHNQRQKNSKPRPASDNSVDDFEEALVPTGQSAEPHRPLPTPIDEKIDIDQITADARLDTIVHQDGKAIQVHLDDRIEDVLFIVTTTPLLIVDSKASVDLVFHMISRPVNARIDGRIFSVYEDGESYYYEFKMEDTRPFELIGRLYELRQKMINKFYVLANGF